MSSERILPVKRILRDQDEDLEGHLLSSLGPIQPNPEFVQRLKTRLTTEPVVTVERQSQLLAFVVMGLGLFFGAFLVWAVLFVKSLLVKQPQQV
jgi:hypothetical protein